jgi:hypothetical protein
MNRSLIVAQILFINKALRSDGQAFEDLFIRTMEEVSTSFQPVKPQGSFGDKKNDGFDSVTGEYYQCYAPEDLAKNISTAINKLQESADGLVGYWDGISKIKKIYFVVNDNYKGLYPEIHQKLAELRTQYVGIEFELFRTKDLERKVLSLDIDAIERIIGFLPNLQKESLDPYYLTDILSHSMNFELDFIEKDLSNVFLNNSEINFIQSEEEVNKATNIFQLVCHYKSEYTLKYDILGRLHIFGLDIIYNQEDFQSRLRITILENKGGWSIKNTFIIKNEGIETYCSFDKGDFKIIDNQVFIVFETSSAGTFFNGMQTYNFCLFNLFDNSHEILKYFYISGNFVGEYVNIEDVSEESQKIIYPLAVNFLENKGIGKEDDIEENSFPHLKWIANNSTIYEDIKDNKDHYYDLRIGFTPIDKEMIPKLSDYDGDLDAYTSNISTLENNDYVIYGGFAASIIGINKAMNNSFVIFVPEGFPSGGGWGVRSFELLSLNENILIIQNYLYRLTIDLSNGYVSIGESSLLDDADKSANQEYNLKDFFKNIFSR